MSERLTRHAIELPTGVTLNVMERSGTGTPVICLHGIWDRWDYWLPLTGDGPGTFNGRPLYMVDHRGHGDSSKPDSGYGWDAYCGDLLALIEELGFARLTLVGHSLGSLTSLLAAAQTPDRIESMLLEDPPIPLNGDSAVAFRGLLELKQQPFEAVVEELTVWRNLPRNIAEDSAGRLLGTADGVLREASEGILNTVTIPPPGVTIDAPTLVIQTGNPEQRAFQDSGRAILDTVLTDYRVETVPDTSHNVLRDAPDAYRRILADFFDG